MPTHEEALQFAIMLSAGLPAEQAILYFTSESDPAVVSAMLSKWTRSKALQNAQLQIMGKSWTEMTLEEKIDCGLNYTYAQMAYLLFSSNYLTVGPNDKAKLDTARQALEAKKAGLAGKGDALSRFFDDVQSGKLKLQPVPKRLDS